MRLNRHFYKRSAVIVARELLGKELVRLIDGEKIVSKIVETEAYEGPKDKASHAYNNRKTQRTQPMFSVGGTVYIYMIYGMHHCFNVVTGEVEYPAAVLIRAVEPVTGKNLMKENRKITSNDEKNLTNGPGKLCEALKITRHLSGIDLVTSNQIYIREGAEEKNDTILTARRVNISYAQEYQKKQWRFLIKGNPFVSKQKK